MRDEEFSTTHQAVMRAATRVRGSDPDDVREGAVIALGIAARAHVRVAGNASDAEALPELAGGVQAVSALHSPEPDVTCRCCRAAWPCSTIRVMAGVMPGLRRAVEAQRRAIARRLS